MGWSECVIDATFEPIGGMFTFCPIGGDINGEFSVVTGMNFVSEVPPEGMRLVAVVHPDGQQATEEYCDEWQRELDALREKIGRGK